ncbi:major facilitator superfamily MFS_1 [Acidilobus saccharovorans 345-15]|uniref:Major facilitator superfamily MFS_1 n=1 Tax=Acidilobus saccharovorans (strain DSM 16705 / JCM 18335 / VKM B-2471 / 345-15) TaxID=666510 RepID=D9Q1R4_ACIS3|nr:MFS transporter [Acidilobus saccharovorans]ADL19252.1 major facilitator superfamily MFS_1 [Acidilobus saccharovorans 345-15]
MRPEDRLAIIGALRVLGFSIALPFAGLALNLDFREPLAVVSEFYASLAVASAVGQVVGGYVSDRTGRVRTMFMSGLVASLSLAVAALLWRATAIEVLLAVQSFFSNAYSVASMAIVGDYFSEHSSLVKAYGRLRVGSNLGWALGIAVGGELYALIGFRWLLAVTSAVLAASLAALWGLGEPPRSELAVAFERPTPVMVKFLAPTFMTFIIAGLMGYPLVQYFSGFLRISTSYSGALLAINGLMVVLLQDMVARKASAHSPAKSLATGMAIYGLGYGLMPMVNSVPAAALDIMLITLGEMIVMPVSSAVAAELSSPRARGSHMSLYGIANTIGRNLSSAIFAAAAYSLGASYGWALMASIAMASSVGYLAVIG